MLMEIQTHMHHTNFALCGECNLSGAQQLTCTYKREALGLLNIGSNMQMVFI